MHMQAQITGILQCPNCTHPDETLDHIFHCQHPTLILKWEELLEHLRKKGLKLRMPSHHRCLHETTQILLFKLTNTRGDCLTITTGYRHSVHPERLSRLWVDALEAHHCPHPDCTISSLIHFLLNDLTDNLWWKRNNLVHRTQNLTDLATEASLDNRLLWYTSNKYDLLLTASDHHLAWFTADTLLTMTLRSKKAWVKHLQAAEAAFALEKTHCPSSWQRRITDFFVTKQQS